MTNTSKAESILNQLSRSIGLGIELYDDKDAVCIDTGLVMTDLTKPEISALIDELVDIHSNMTD